MTRKTPKFKKGKIYSNKEELNRAIMSCHFAVLRYRVRKLKKGYRLDTAKY